MIRLPDTLLMLIGRLEAAGFEAYVVGGCVRDCLLHRTPLDWDLCTNATPEQTKAAVAPCPTIDTGLKHGTVTVLWEKATYEITTFRAESSYPDGRHPAEVTFVGDLQADLARRDFTINAMAYHPKQGLIDPFGGQTDLAKGVLRCVGDAHQRLQEDRLRMLRGLRFCAVYGLVPEEKTREGICEGAALVQQLPGERLWQELAKLLVGPWAVPTIREFAVQLQAMLPAVFLPSCNPTPLTRAPKDPLIRLALLLVTGGPPAGSRATNRLRLSRVQSHRLVGLLEHISIPLCPPAYPLPRLLFTIGSLPAPLFFAFRRALCADTQAAAQIDALAQQASQLLAQGLCRKPSDLAITSGTLEQLGLAPGPQMGKVLGRLLDAVLDEQLPNESQALEQAAAAMIHSFQQGESDHA